MKIAIISDVHVKSPGDDSESILLNFFEHGLQLGVTDFVLLGDIFDLMIGPHSQYFHRFSKIFQTIRQILSKNIKIYYVEGNHDFHLKKMFENFFKTFPELPKKNFQNGQEFTFFVGGKSIHMCHGDDVEIDNGGYRIYKKIVTSGPLTYYANYLMPYFLIKNIGEYASKQSRKKNNQRYLLEEDFTPIKFKFRKSFDLFHSKNNFDIFVAGHSHVRDIYCSPKGFLYLNNGYAPKSQSFIVLDSAMDENQKIYQFYDVRSGEKVFFDERL